MPSLIQFFLHLYNPLAQWLTSQLATPESLVQIPSITCNLINNFTSNAQLYFPDFVFYMIWYISTYFYHYLSVTRTK